MTRQYLISGLVQGVGFRWFVLRLAKEAGVSGFVRNLPDGRVEVVARGDTHRLSRLEQGLRRGPAAAEVRQVEEAEISPEPSFDSFMIR